MAFLFNPPLLQSLLLRCELTMNFKDSIPQFQLIDVALVEPDPTHPRRQLDEVALKGLANSIRKIGLIHPVVVHPADPAGRHKLIVGERRWRAAQLAGEKAIPALVHSCESDQTLEIQVFENLGLGLRLPLEPREMANAIQTLTQRFETREAAAEHFGRTATWLNQATAAANLSPKITELLDSGKIASTGAAVQLEKLNKKNEAKAESLIGQIEQLPEGEKLAKKVVDSALSEEGGRRKKKAETVVEKSPQPPAIETGPDSIPPWEEYPAATPEISPASSRGPRVNPGKVKKVAEILGLAEDNEEELLVRLIDEFLALKGEAASE